MNLNLSWLDWPALALVVFLGAVLLVPLGFLALVANAWSDGD